MYASRPNLTRARMMAQIQAEKERHWAEAAESTAASWAAAQAVRRARREGTESDGLSNAELSKFMSPPPPPLTTPPILTKGMQ